MTNEQQDTPVFSLQKLYIKDLSFENPNAPEVFTTPTNQPKIDLNLNMAQQQINDEHWEVTMKISAIARASENDKVMFEVEVEQAGLFLMKNIPDEHMEGVLAVDCPTLLFPYARQQVSQLTVDGGFMPLLLEPVNFAAAYQSNLEQKQSVN